MEAHAIQRTVRQSPRKMRLVATAADTKSITYAISLHLLP